MSSTHKQRASTVRSATNTTQLDALVPTAVEVLHRKRASLQVLRNIDALLLETSGDNSDDDDGNTCERARRIDGHTTLRASTSTAQRTSLSANRGAGSRSWSDGGAASMTTSTTTPGPATYNPTMHVVYKHTHGATTFSAASGRLPRALPWQLVKRTRTPGPGAYAVSDAVAATKPRTVAARIHRHASTAHDSRLASRTQQTIQRPQQQMHASQKTAPRNEPLAAYGAHCRGLVRFAPPNRPTYRSQSQQQRVRAVLAARTRWTRVGFYSVRYYSVEPRVRAPSIHPPLDAQPSDTRTSATRFRYKLRAWRRSSAATSALTNRSDRSTTTANATTMTTPTQRTSTVAWHSKQERDAHTHSVQRTRALAHRVLQATERARYAHDSTTNPSRTGKVPATSVTMNKQLGRDVVTCRQRKQRIVTSFSVVARKAYSSDAPQQHEQQHTHHISDRRAQYLVPFALTSGRESVGFDAATGVYVVGTETDATVTAARGPAALVLDLDRSDAATRRRVPAAHIADPSPSPSTVDKHHVSVLAPSFDLVEPAVRGHRYVRFAKQLERPQRLHAPAGGGSDSADWRNLVLPAEFAVLDKLKYRNAHPRINYMTKTGHNEARPQRRTPIDVAYEPTYALTQARTQAPVDMSTMLARPEEQSETTAFRHD